AGFFVLTNDPQSRRIRAPLTVEVLPALTATPATVNVGNVAAGKSVERRITIRGGQPFKITKVEGSDGQMQVADLPNEAKSVHVLKITLTPEAVGELHRKLKIVTDLPRDNTVIVSVLGQAN
ncbi:MAG TPA: hypothetical protein PKC45_15615, partial [Gemmatales bacterium]|nr:hypothetical protein [Gemmatales bacterium]